MALHRLSSATLGAAVHSVVVAVERALWALDAVLGAWRHRHATRRELRDLPPHMLRDIGLTPGEALREADKPFWRP
jgi:uncharacterized protein YjiS (DUF1127 family)